jgi:hypothetical protein
MEEHSQTQGIAYSAGERAYQPASALAEPASRLDTLERLLRLLLRRLLYGLVVLGELIKPRIASIIIIAVLLGVIGFETLALVAPLFTRASADSRVALIEPNPAVVSFLQGQRDFDADKMWESFSADLQASLIDQDITKDALAQQLESERSAGQRYRGFEYVGGVNTASNQQMFFYVVDIDSPAPERNGKFSFVFIVDGSGKIVGIRM